MRTYLECIPCFTRQALEAVRMASDDARLHERVMRGVLLALADMRFDDSPPAMGRTIHRMIRRATGNFDPYRAIKDESNRIALALLPELRRCVENAPDPFALALRLSITANVIDFGVRSEVDLDEVAGELKQAGEIPLDPYEVEALRHAVAAADEILFIADNAGETVIDRLFLEQMPSDRIAVAVRGGPAINDATRADAEAAGIAGIAEIIETGSDAPGVILSDCSDEFRERFDRAPVVIAKGQGNYEALSDVDREVFFLLRAKCSVAARDLQCAVGDSIVRRKHETEQAGLMTTSTE
jgi:uncharacterized protein with ATP-grasp and redox domains